MWCEERDNYILEVFLSLSSCRCNLQPDSHHTSLFTFHFGGLVWLLFELFDTWPILTLHNPWINSVFLTRTGGWACEVSLQQEVNEVNTEKILWIVQTAVWHASQSERAGYNWMKWFLYNSIYLCITWSRFWPIVGESSSIEYLTGAWLIEISTHYIS